MVAATTAKLCGETVGYRFPAAMFKLNVIG
jgi:hypothetical protein